MHVDYLRMRAIQLQCILFILIIMFVTHTSAKSPIPSLFGDSSYGHWHSVELALHSPWFLASFRQRDSDADGEYELNRTVLLTSLDSVAHLVQEGNRGVISFDSLQIVTPGRLNGSNDWKMEHLLAVWLAHEPNAPGQFAEVFETEGGARYSNSMNGTSIDELKPETLVLRAPIDKRGQVEH